MNRFQSVLDPAGPQAARIDQLWWFLFWVATAVFVLVAAALLVGIWRASRRRAMDDERAPLAVSADGERRITRVVAACVGATAGILLIHMIASFSTGRAVAAIPAREAMLIEITGRRWWWDVQYVDTNPSRRVRTANEIHIPVGRPVMLALESGDVIHSLWIPNLHGKRDLIPRKASHTWIQADTAGVYRAQCAEFCGHQHAKMSLYVIAESEADFQRWYASQLAPAPSPGDSITRRGHDVFMTGTCVMCHAITGTPAGSRIGPDLTHVGSRLSIGAGTLPNSRGHLAGWVLDPQRIKPGVLMPPNQLEPGDLHALLAYLESLR